MLKNVLIFPFLLLVLAPFPVAAEIPLGTPDPYDILYPDDEEPSAAEIQLGHQLFFDPRLSASGRVSCATCHLPEAGLGDGLERAQGNSGKPLRRNTPHLYNLAWNLVFFWDGRATSLEEQSLMPISDPEEMNLPLPRMIEILGGVKLYRNRFEEIYGSGGLTADNVGRALAAFQRTLVSDNAPFDRFMAGNRAALSEEAVRGMRIFIGKGRCTKCHDGPNFTDQSFHNIGVGGDDPGRFEVVADESLRGAFKTPGLRNVALTAPYMHNGSIGTLEEVIRFYNRGGDRKDNLSKLIVPLGLSEREIADLLAFLGALTDPVWPARPALPD